MNKFFKLAVNLACLLFIFIPNNCFASAEFKTDYLLKYTVMPNATMEVNQQITLTNLLNQIYLKSYQIILGSTQISKIFAFDNFGPLDPKIEERNNATQINLEFGQKVVGQDQVRNFTLNYQSLDYATLNGQVLEIRIPKVKTEINETYSLYLNVPISFGEPIFIKPQPSKISQSLEYSTYYYQHQDLNNKSIIASFGSEQDFDFELLYHLNNSENKPINTEIALPPDTLRQKVFFHEIFPAPENVVVDQDGNFLALYSLKPLQNLNIKALGSVHLLLKPDLTKEFIKPKLDSLVLAQKYWEVSDNLIKNKAHELKTPDKIFQFVVDTLDYDYEKIDQQKERLGALKAFQNPNQAVCMEFTDLFIALCRSAGIPAREINGYAYTTNAKLRPLGLNQDILHAWPEYYDQSLGYFIPVDPTWTKTTNGIDFFNQFDLNHFTFVVHGVDSAYPVAAGGYKDQAVESNDVKIKFGQKAQEITNYQLTVETPTKVYFAQNLMAKIKIKNLGNSSLINKKIFLSLAGFINYEKEIEVDIIPAYGSKEITVNLGKINQFFQDKITLQASFLDQVYTQQIKVNMIDLVIIIIGVCIVLFLFLFVLFLIRRRRSE